jgi:cutinase
MSANGTNIGADDVAKRINAQISACPQQMFALVGYSQGARVVRIGGTKLSAAAQEKVVAAAVYGDSGAKRGTVNFPPAILARTKVNCVPGDPVGSQRLCAQKEQQR